MMKKPKPMTEEYAQIMRRLFKLSFEDSTVERLSLEQYNGKAGLVQCLQKMHNAGLIVFDGSAVTPILVTEFGELEYLEFSLRALKPTECCEREDKSCCNKPSLEVLPEIIRDYLWQILSYERHHGDGTCTLYALNEKRNKYSPQFELFNSNEEDMAVIRDILLQAVELGFLSYSGSNDEPLTLTKEGMEILGQDSTGYRSKDWEGPLTRMMKQMTHDEMDAYLNNRDNYEPMPDPDEHIVDVNKMDIQ